VNTTGSPRLAESETPFLETPAGGLFFVNLLLATPAMVVMVPLVLKGIASTLGLVRGPAPILDTIPIVVGHALPFIGWVFVLALLPIAKNLKMTLPTWAGRALRFFAMIHVGVVGYSVLSWLT